MEELREQVEDNGMDNLWQIVLNTREQCEILGKLMSKQIEIKDEMINKLHKELEFYKQDSMDRFINQLMKTLIKVRNDMYKTINGNNWEELQGKEVKKEYIYIFEDITDLLFQQDIDTYRSTSGTYFDPAIHQARLEVTDKIELDKTIKNSVSDGYKKKDKVLIPEIVTVYQFKKEEKKL